MQRAPSATLHLFYGTIRQLGHHNLGVSMRKFLRQQIQQIQQGQRYYHTDNRGYPRTTYDQQLEGRTCPIALSLLSMLSLLS